MPSPAVLDHAAIAELRSLDPSGTDELLRDLLRIFIQDTPPRLAAMEQALHGADGAAFGWAAHSIKGSAAHLGAEALWQAADEAERSGRAGKLEKGAGQLTRLRTEFDRARSALERISASRGGSAGGRADA